MSSDEDELAELRAARAGNINSQVISADICVTLRARHLYAVSLLQNLREGKGSSARKLAYYQHWRSCVESKLGQARR